MKTDQQTSYHVASAATMAVERPPLAATYDEVANASRAAWRHYKALEDDYNASFELFADTPTHEAWIAAAAWRAQLCKRLDAALDEVTRLQQEEYALYVQVMAWYAKEK